MLQAGNMHKEHRVGGVMKVWCWPLRRELCRSHLGGRDTGRETASAPGEGCTLISGGYFVILYRSLCLETGLSVPVH